MSSLIRVSEATKAKIAKLSTSTGRPMTEVVDQAVDALERRLFMEEFNRRYAELRADPVAWAEIEAERKLWDNTLMDGLDD